MIIFCCIAFPAEIGDWIAGTHEAVTVYDAFGVQPVVRVLGTVRAVRSLVMENEDVMCA